MPTPLFPPRRLAGRAALAGALMVVAAAAVVLSVSPSHVGAQPKGGKAPPPLPPRPMPPLKPPRPPLPPKPAGLTLTPMAGLYRPSAGPAALSTFTGSATIQRAAPPGRMVPQTVFAAAGSGPPPGQAARITPMKPPPPPLPTKYPGSKERAYGVLPAAAQVAGAPRGNVSPTMRYFGVTNQIFGKIPTFTNLAPSAPGQPPAAKVSSPTGGSFVAARGAPNPTAPKVSPQVAQSREYRHGKLPPPPPGGGSAIQYSKLPGGYGTPAARNVRADLAKLAFNPIAF